MTLKEPIARDLKLSINMLLRENRMWRLASEHDVCVALDEHLDVN